MPRLLAQQARLAELRKMDKILTSGDVTLEMKAGTFGGNPTITVSCRNLPVVIRTPQEFLDWIAPFVDQEAKPYDSPETNSTAT
jgi:hypothetical protein